VPHFIDTFKFNLHSELEALEREVVQSVSERILKEGDAFPAGENKLTATLVVDLEKVKTSALTVRSVVQEVE
jgi:hypothetical protein